VRKALTAYYGMPYGGAGAGSLGGGFGKPSGVSFTGKPVRVRRDSQNRPVLTTARPSGSTFRRAS
jgi:hypothetical protein